MNSLYFGITALSGWASLVAQTVKNLPAMQNLAGKIPWRKKWLQSMGPRIVRQD